uniref:SH2 domain-containing protein n=1 Tax=Timema genevievae TaxID=629358 RepID=A0A7R9JRV7_TIMGE|nr:unnamed protein product [Timema genevievae]
MRNYLDFLPPAPLFPHPPDPGPHTAHRYSTSSLPVILRICPIHQPKGSMGTEDAPSPHSPSQEDPNSYPEIDGTLLTSLKPKPDEFVFHAPWRATLVTLFFARGFMLVTKFALLHVTWSFGLQILANSMEYACQSNLPNTVRILVQVGYANVQARNTETGWVPLHEAASLGLKEVVHVLLSLNAPVNPRTSSNETPADLAQQNGHLDCAHILRNYMCPAPKTHKNDWYHGTLGRNEALCLLKEHGNKDGTFLVRYSDRNGGVYVLTTIHGGQPYHFQIKIKLNFYFIDDGPYLDSLEHVIEHYSLMSDGLPTTLQVAVPPRPKPPLPDMPPSLLLNGFSTLSSRRQTKQTPNRNHASQTLSNGVSPCHSRKGSLVPNNENTFVESTLPLPLKVIVMKEPIMHEFIPGDCLSLGPVLGEGEFGSVYKGVFCNQNGKKVQELVPLGSMLAYLLEFPDRVHPNYELKLWASQIACEINEYEAAIKLKEMIPGTAGIAILPSNIPVLYKK